MDRGVNGEPSFDLDGGSVSRVNPLYQDPNVGVYGIHNPVAESPHQSEQDVIHSSRDGPTQQSRKKKSKFGMFSGKRKASNTDYDRQSSASSRSSVSSGSSEGREERPQQPTRGLFGFFSGRRPNANNNDNYHTDNGAIPLHSKMPITEDDPERDNKRCWLIIKTFIVIVLLLLCVALLVVVLVVIKDRTFDDEEEPRTTPTTEEPPPRFEAVTVEVSMILSRSYLDAYNTTGSAERLELERKYKMAIYNIFSDTYLNDDLLYVQVLEISEDYSDDDCTYILSKLVYSKDVLDDDIDVEVPFSHIQNELRRITQDTQQFILDDATRRDGEIRKLDVKPISIIIDAAMLELLPIPPSTRPVASTLPVTEAESTTLPPITQRSTTKQPTVAPSTTEQTPTTERVPPTTREPTTPLETTQSPTTEKVTTEGATEGPCPPGLPLVNCLINPCDVTYCYLRPDAICIPDYCGGCNANFYDWSTGARVACWNDCLNNGESPVSCSDNPCDTAVCPLRPDAICRANNCGGCNAEFYDNNGYPVPCRDNTLPSVNCPENVGASIQYWQAGTRVLFDQASASDDRGIALLEYTQYSGDFFYKGVTTVTVTAVDFSGNVAYCTFEVNVFVTDVAPTLRPLPTRPLQTTLGETTPSQPTPTEPTTIRDSDPPRLTCPLNIIQSADSGQDYGTIYWRQPTAVDNSGTNVDVSTDRQWGSKFELGVTFVTVTATDEAENSNTCIFRVEVVDTEAPVLICPRLVIFNADPGEDFKNVTLPEPGRSANDIIATDNSRIAPVISPYEVVRTFDIGETEVVITGTDSSENVGRCVITVVVLDNQNPTIRCPGNIIVFSFTTDPVPFTVPDPEAKDNSGSVDISLTIDSLSAVPEYIFTMTGHYVTYTARDEAGNSASCQFQIEVKAIQAIYEGTATLNRLYASGAYDDETSAEYKAIKRDFETGVSNIVILDTGLNPIYERAFVSELREGQGDNVGRIVVYFRIGYSSIPTDLATLATDTTTILEAQILDFDDSLGLIPGIVGTARNV